MDKRAAAERGLVAFYATGFLSAVIIGLYETYLLGFPPSETFYLVPPGFFHGIPLYLQAVPLNLSVFGCFGLCLLKPYRAKALPMFVFSYCVWDVLTMPFNQMPLIYAAVYFPVLVLSYALVMPKHHVGNVYTVAMLFYQVREPLVSILPYAWTLMPVVGSISQFGYDAVFFVFIWKSFALSNATLI